MYAISFDMEVAKLKEHYGEPYNKAYDEIRAMMEELGFMEDLGFIGTQGSLYLSKNEKNDLTTVYKIINKLSNVQWFADSVRDIRAFKVEDWSDFTEIVKNKN
jgi:virulence-associated protein VapD